ncbi:tRNA (adenosine(37)-N6)-threonylcarbamoyltransferase complex dimerization subunit type 1 TsaB [Candidatus Peregrinibacteria bacterium]|jgi:tRNA threonylcarbamoyl adenosine modification protein YeaZ|nr:tRNA (adenosine(37)-N6)-threonylcarbamoyltransferase complex dimerization subunit type 1 TsaB [Candidatus Peregrinibacteria bacterium]MBT4148723.1 tRNA (adenosine(37)-N6)-threonylcarbamoyltransferase complex dimerization subunit type 1 TsaB [Candidatus Peregrinibacteria bacterium]MBT4366214.1 tRNA (adenosine(37)-N6)-threonylcarbamoyltransferase complex dimerization subunit type 1 TsaB [Candidatus Peregrinibacteria bacterium]MBT4456278.1 tRNA (adenosine(37)-N6)-threonylcarbamoyltransferase com
MVTLAINTATLDTEIAILDLEAKKILAEKSWRSECNEAETLLPEILKLLKKSKINFKDLKKVIVVKGPGSFTGLRVGITIANMIANLLKIPVEGVDTFTFLERSFPKEITEKKDATLILFAGRKEVYLKSTSPATPQAKPALIKLEEVQPSKALYGELRPDQDIPHESKRATLGKTILNLKPKDLKKEKIINPVYIKGPAISKPKPIK